jgi:MFS family permease
MLKKIIHRLLSHRHFWREASFSEIAELYASKMLRMLALSMASSFISIYLYQNGYSILSIALFWVVYFAFKAFIALPSAALTAWLGPKHVILLSNLLFIPALVAYALIPEYGDWLLPFVILFQGASTTLYVIGYSVDFSKVKHADHAGKELAYMNIIEKFTTGLSPLIGGLLAFLFGPQVTLMVAAVIFIFAALPLLRSSEPTLRHQRLHFKGFPWNLVRGTVASQFALGFDVFTSGTVWWLFTAIAVIGIESNNDIYAANGLLLSVILFAALGASYTFGKLIDRRRGRDLLHLASVFNALTHFMRPFVTTPIAVAGLNIANETATTGYTMAYNRGVYDNADLSGNRIAYLGVMEILSCVGAAVSAMVLVIILGFFGDVRAMEYQFVVTAGVVLLIGLARFPLYRK